MRALATVWIALAVVACGANSGTADYPSFIAATRRVFCERQADCGFLDRAYVMQCESAFRHGENALDAFAASPHVTFSPIQAAACLDAIKSALAYCHSISFLPSVSGVMRSAAACKSVVSGKSPEGSPCPNRVECVSGTFCAMDFSQPDGCGPTCISPQPLGGTCGDADSPCDGTAYCDHLTLTCAERLDVGATCFVVDACKNGLSCEPTTGEMKACRLQGGPGDLCSNEYSCQEGLVCSPTADPAKYVCRTPDGPGPSCPANDGRPCEWGLVCFTTGCAPGYKLGEPCFSSILCGERLVCIGASSFPFQMGTCRFPLSKGESCIAEDCQAPHVCRDGICTPPGEIGAPCADVMCLDGYCNYEGTLTDGLCAPRIKAGEACAPDKGASPCEGNLHCDPSTRVCQSCSA
jgi:hypothetical protein